MAFTPSPKDNIKYNVTKVERETQFKQMETIELTKLGTKFAPDGNLHVGSVALHFYVHKFGPEAMTKVQITNFTKVTENHAQHGMKELISAVLKMYGRMPPKKRFEDWSDNSAGNTSLGKK